MAPNTREDAPPAPTAGAEHRKPPAMQRPRRLIGLFRTSLEARVVVLMALICLAIAVPAWMAFDRIVTDTTVKLGKLFAEKQILYDRYRGLETLRREASLAQTLARAPAIVEWAADESSPEKRARGIAELEHYREAFEDQSYFFVIDESGNYYFNDRADAYAGRQLRYQVEESNPRDGWYFKTVAGPDGCQPNVDHDDNLQVTKVWINCKVMEGDETVGVVGTGIDLTSFIREVVDVRQEGVESIFMDRSGAIQAHRDPTQIDFHSLTKDLKAKNTIFKLLDEDGDRAAVRAMMERAAAGEGTVEARFVRIDGRKALAGIGYMDEIGWFNVTLMDIDQIIDNSVFRPIALLLAAILIAAVALATVLFKRSVLDRLALLESWVGRVRTGDFSGMDPPHAADEIGRLTGAFVAMARSVGAYTQQLEDMVRARTETLERLAHIDPVTGINNRRGFLAALEPERNRADRVGAQLGLILVDLDLFKAINDSLGHNAGDEVLAEVARRLAACVRTYDVVARWGGDEFIMLVSVTDGDTLLRIAEKVHAAVGGSSIRLDNGVSVRITVSVGATMIADDVSVDTVTAQADAALYEAKNGGRDRVALYDPETARSRAQG